MPPPSAEAWIAAGVPEEAGIRHRVTFEDGRLDDQCILADGTLTPCWIGATYRPVGDHEVEFGDDSVSFRLRWRLEGDSLTFEMDPDEGGRSTFRTGAGRLPRPERYRRISPHGTRALPIDAPVVAGTRSS